MNNIFIELSADEVQIMHDSIWHYFMSLPCKSDDNSQKMLNDVLNLAQKIKNINKITNPSADEIYMVDDSPEASSTLDKVLKDMEIDIKL